ncbi:F-box/kelch-repeat protein At3g23880-like [Rosa rugosa]|uniref:F-box/kelch-repeat protein At3g23880-like n=1 Tax=Rosa rugosa TaxID=74645 RepID=UPI002B404C0C|nr:F-box/kelch-repeat protein At3g23880-like [Rosa rugosa]
MAAQNSDVEEKILSLLPPKTLMRFKLVSKRWYALISNPRFVDKHLSNFNSMHNNPSTSVFIKRLVVNEDTKESETVFSLLSFSNCSDDDSNDGGEPASFLLGVEDMEIPFPMTSLDTNRGESLEIVGHCNGIICLSISRSTKVFLWNPAIRELKLLPPEPYLPHWTRTCSTAADYPKDVVTMPFFSDDPVFGYDPLLQDYKVVEIGFQGAYREEDNYVFHPPLAAVYTRGTNSWREISTDSLETETTNLWPGNFQMFFNGMCYWLGREQLKEGSIYDYMEEEYVRKLIISFDMSREVFHDILLPYELINPPCITVWKESIALFNLRDSDDADSSNLLPYSDASDAAKFECLDIWVMDGFAGVGYSWTKHLTLELREHPSQSISSLWWDQTTLVMWNHELLMVSPNRSIVCYNLSSRRLKYLPIQSGSKDREAVAAVYLNSIVSVVGDKKLQSRENVAM